MVQIPCGYIIWKSFVNFQPTYRPADKKCIAGYFLKSQNFRMSKTQLGVAINSCLYYIFNDNIAFTF